MAVIAAIISVAILAVKRTLQRILRTTEKNVIILTGHWYTAHVPTQ